MNVQKLLEKSFLTRADLPDRGVELRVHRLDYPFFTRLFYKSSSEEMTLESFQAYLENFSRIFMSRWITTRVKPEDWEKHLQPFFYFQSKADLKKLFQTVNNDPYNEAEILLPVSNARLQIKRLGNCLGLRLNSNNTPLQDVIHVHGTELLKNLCDEGHGHIHELLHSIECIIPLPRMRGENNSVTINLGLVFSQIEKACPYFGWENASDSVNPTLKSYMTPPDYNFSNRPSIGWYKNDKSALSIHAALVHWDNRKETESPQWRRGNFEQITPYNFKFYDGKDLCLSLRICDSIPASTFLQRIDPDLDIDSQQDALFLAGATLYSQLSAMIANGIFAV